MFFLFLLTQSTILFMQFASNVVNVSPSEGALCLVRFKFPVRCCLFHKPCVFFIQLSSDIVKVSSTDEALYCLVRLSSCLYFLFVSRAFLEEVWNKTQIENVSIFIIYLMCKQLHVYLKLFCVNTIRHLSRK